MSSYLELAIIAVILIGIALAVWRGGQANPESTGKLNRRLTAMDGELREVVNRVGTLDRRVGDIERHSAKSADIARLEKHLEALKEQVAGLRASDAGMVARIDHACQQVDRLYDFIVERGMKS